MSVALLAPPAQHGSGSPAGGLALVPEADEIPIRPDGRLEVVVSERRSVAADVVLVGLDCPDGGRLPEWEPGAHIELSVSSEPVRAFSLCGEPGDRTRWSVAISRRAGRSDPWWAAEDRLPVGVTVRVSEPRNQFPLIEARRYLFVASGTGIAPIRTMVAAAAVTGAEWQLLYLGGSRSRMPFVDELTARYGDRVRVHARDEAGLLDLGVVLGRTTDDGLVYCCGSAELVARITGLCRHRPVGTLHVDRAAVPAVVQDPAGPR